MCAVESGSIAAREEMIACMLSAKHGLAQWICERIYIRATIQRNNKENTKSSVNKISGLHKHAQQQLNGI